MLLSQTYLDPRRNVGTVPQRISTRGVIEFDDTFTFQNISCWGNKIQVDINNPTLVNIQWFIQGYISSFNTRVLSPVAVVVAGANDNDNWFDVEGVTFLILGVKRQMVSPVPIVASYRIDYFDKAIP